MKDLSLWLLYMVGLLLGLNSYGYHVVSQPVHGIIAYPATALALLATGGFIYYTVRLLKKHITL
jgi:hypothetical protein